MPLCRLIVDAPLSGVWNMAVDEVLLDQAATLEQASLRFYQWSEPTLSLGYFQSYEDRAQHAESRACPIVRRQSGGGAIVHDQELTYTLALPAAETLARDPQALYEAVHGSLLDALAEGQVGARLCESPAKVAAHAEPFLCFARRASGDVLLGGSKICGSAQRRGRGAVVQHGSVLLAQSDAAPQLPGIAELAGVRLKPAQLIATWQPRLAARAGLDLAAGKLDTAADRQVRTLALEKYDMQRWTQRR
jgi:lipoate-protein ligase A